MEKLVEIFFGVASGIIVGAPIALCIAMQFISHVSVLIVP